MLISLNKKFIFLAVPKTATTSIERALDSYASSGKTRGLNKHVLAMKAVELVPPSEWESCFRFAFVREPFDWFYSWYRYRQRPALQDPGHRFHHRYTGEMSFEEFVLGFDQTEMFLKQSDYLCDREGNLLVDFVGRFEHLEEDFARVCERLELPLLPLGHARQSQQARGIVELTDAGQAKLRRYFQRDFELFGY